MRVHVVFSVGMRRNKQDVYFLRTQNTSFSLFVSRLVESHTLDLSLQHSLSLGCFVAMCTDTGIVTQTNRFCVDEA